MRPRGPWWPPNNINPPPLTGHLGTERPDGTKNQSDSGGMTQEEIQRVVLSKLMEPQNCRVRGTTGVEILRELGVINSNPLGEANRQQSQEVMGWGNQPKQGKTQLQKITS